MNYDDIERALTGQNITGTDALVALALVIFGAISSLVIGSLCRRWSGRWREAGIPGEVSDIGIRLVQILVLVVFVSWALSVLGADLGLLNFVVIALLVFAFLVAKPYLEGVASSVVVASRSAFSVGDEIAVDGVAGRVERIANRSTVLRTRDGLRVHIPNSELVDKVVTVFTAFEERRSSVELTVGPASDLDEVDRIIRTSLNELDEIERVGAIRARGFSGGVDLSIRFWHGPLIVDGNDAIDAAVRAIKTAFEQVGIELAPASSIRVEGGADGPR